MGIHTSHAASPICSLPYARTVRGEWIPTLLTCRYELQRLLLPCRAVAAPPASGGIDARLDGRVGTGLRVRRLPDGVGPHVIGLQRSTAGGVGGSGGEGKCSAATGASCSSLCALHGCHRMHGEIAWRHGMTARCAALETPSPRSGAHLVRTRLYSACKREGRKLNGRGSSGK